METEAWGHEHGAWGPECGDGTVRRFISGCLLSKKFFDGDGIMRQFFLVVFCHNFFDGDRTVRHIFVFCQHGDRSIEM